MDSQVVQMRASPQGQEYLLKWKGRPWHQATWERDVSDYQIDHYMKLLRNHRHSNSTVPYKTPSGGYYYYTLFDMDYTPLHNHEAPLLQVETVSSPTEGSVQGDFLEGDSAQSIQGVNNEGDTLLFLVRWQKREGDVQPKDSVVDRDSLVAFDSDLLLDYY